MSKPFAYIPMGTRVATMEIGTDFNDGEIAHVELTQGLFISKRQVLRPTDPKVTSTPAIVKVINIPTEFIIFKKDELLWCTSSFFHPIEKALPHLKEMQMVWLGSVKFFKKSLNAEAVVWFKSSLKRLRGVQREQRRLHSRLAEATL